MEVLSKLGIDLGALVFYLINFGVLLLAVSYLITGPILKAIDKRRHEIKSSVEQAEKIKTEFVAEKAKSDRERQELRNQMDQQLSDLKKELELRRKEQEEALEAKKTKMLSDVRELVEQEKAGILKAAEKQTLTLIEKIVMHVVSNKVPQDVVKGSVEEAWKSFKS